MSRDGFLRFRHLRLLLAANPTTSDVLLLVTGVLVAIIASIPLPISVSYYGTLLDDLNNECGASDPEAVHRVVVQKVLAMAALGLAYLVTIYVYTGACGLFGERLVYRIRCKYVEAALRQEVGFLDDLPPGEVATSLDTSMQAIQSGVSEKVGFCLFSISYVAVAFAVCFMQDAQLTVMLAAVIPVLAALSALNMYFSSKFTTAVEKGLQKATNTASDCLSNIAVIQAFKAAGRFEGIFARQLLDIQPAAIGKFVAAASQLGILYLAIFVSNAIAVWQGSRQIADGAASGESRLEYGRVWVVMLLMFDSSGVLAGVAPIFGSFQAASLAFERLERLMSRVSAIDSTRESPDEPMHSIKGNIRFEDVSFQYSSLSTPVLKQLSLSIAASKMTALVGPSGGGKTTVAALIARLYDTDQGLVSIDGMDITKLSPAILRRHIAFVEQDPVLLDMSILENVLSGLYAGTDSDLDSVVHLVDALRGGVEFNMALEQFPEVSASVKRVIHALEKAGAWDFVRAFSHGLATKVGPKGQQLSGGQRQRIAMARALVRDAPILILDEATAALDSANEEYIQEVLKTEFAGRTILCIAHRLSTIKSADHIVVLDEGRVLEEGSFDELVARDGTFTHMVQLQSMNSQDSGDRVFNRVIQPKLGSREPESPDRTQTTINATEISEVDINDTAPRFTSVFRQILRLSRPQRAWILLGVAAAFFIGQAHVLLSVLTGLCVKDVNVCAPEPIIRSSGERYGLIFLLLALSEFSANVCSSSSFGWAAEKLLLRIRVQLLRAFLSQDVAWHESDGRSPNSLLTHISADTASLGSITGNVLGVVLGVVIAVVSGIILAHIVAWRIALALLFLVPLLFITSWMRQRVLTQYQERHKIAFATSVAVAKEAVDAIKTVSLFGLEGERLAAYKRALRGPYDATLQTVAYGNLWLAIANSAQVFIFGAAYWWGAKIILDGYNTQSEFFTAMLAMLFGAQAAGILLSMGTDFSRAQVAAGKVLELLPLTPPYTISGKDIALATATAIEPDEESALLGNEPFTATETRADGMHVSFESVHFRYPSRPSVEVLRGLSLEVPAGSMAAIVGPSGSGKTTVLSLLQQFYQPESGQIKLDSVQLDHHKPETLDAISWAPQSASLFVGSVAFNISIGAGASGQNISHARVEEAAKAANIHDLVCSLPEGYNTEVGTDGSRLSGGQRHRIALARALVRPSRLLLLDEPTAALDAESESKWQDTLQQLRKKGNVTIILVAQRLATIRDADVIFYVQDGQCVASGTNSDLMNSCDAYRQSVAHQNL